MKTIMKKIIETAAKATATETETEENYVIVEEQTYAGTNHIIIKEDDPEKRKEIKRKNFYKNFLIKY